MEAFYILLLVFGILVLFLCIINIFERKGKEPDLNDLSTCKSTSDFTRFRRVKELQYDLEQSNVKVNQLTVKVQNLEFIKLKCDADALISQNKINELKWLVDSKERQLSAKEKEIQTLNFDLSNKKAVINGLNFEKNELQDLNANLNKELDEAEYVYRELYDKYECAKSDITNLEQKVDDFDQMINAKNPFDYVAHLRAHALEHIKEYEDKKVDELAELFKYQYKFEYLLSIYPELRKFKDDDAYINYMHEEEKRCNIKNWLSDEEYFQLSEEGREQLAVDRYISDSSKWSDWEKGRNYEIYCAYILYNEGYDIIQEGLNKKLEDKGRDIIAIHRESGKVLIVQCKNWKSEVRENIIFQLFGSYAQWLFENGRKLYDPDVAPWIYVTGSVSPVAQDCAKMLKIQIRHLPMGPFPPIKCNVNKNTGEKIYHLPFDRHYDLVKINAKGKGYKFEIAEAIQEGFRHV
jgi:hypothetical protein